MLKTSSNSTENKQISKIVNINNKMQNNSIGSQIKKLENRLSLKN